MVSRTRIVICGAWSIILTMICVTHVTLRVATFMTCIAGSVFLCMSVYCFLCRSRVVLVLGGIVLLTAMYGHVYQRICLGHPLQMGTQMDIDATVKSVTVKHGADDVSLVVHREGQPVCRCDFMAIWRVSGAVGTKLSPGQNIVVTGLFIDPSFLSASSPIQNWLSPTWTFEGRLTRILPQTTGNATILHIQRAMESELPASSSTYVNLALSMIVGQAANVSATTKTIFLDAGVTHLLAASGANVILFERLFSWLIRPVFQLPFMRYWRVEQISVQAAGWLFVVLCGFTTPLVRAAFLTTYRSSAMLFHRHVSGPCALSISCVLLALFNPYELTSISGIFSILATFAVMMAGTSAKGHAVHRGRFGPRQFLRRTLAHVLRHMRMVFVTSLYVEIYMTPFVWWWFAQWTPYGMISSLICEPLVVVLMPLTVLWGLIAEMNVLWHNPCVVEVAKGIGFLTVLTLHVLVGCLAWIAGHRTSLIHLPPLPTWLLMCYYIGVMLLQFHARLFGLSLYVRELARVK